MTTPSPSQKQMALGGISIDRPLPPENVTPVRVGAVAPGMGSGSGTTGYVCSSGSALVSTASGPVAEAWAQVIQLNGTVPPAPDPAISTKGRPTGQSTWEVSLAAGGSDIPGASCAAAAPLPENTLAVWVKMQNESTYRTGSSNFIGQCGGATACGGGGGMAAFDAALSVTFGPVQWNLDVAGFLEAHNGGFNGAWVLSLRVTVGPGPVWDNGGDGELIPHIELRCPGPGERAWRLRLRHGPALAEYEAEAAERHALGRLTLGRLAAALDAVPAALTLEPV